MRKRSLSRRILLFVTGFGSGFEVKAIRTAGPDGSLTSVTDPILTAWPLFTSSGTSVAATPAAVGAESAGKRATSIRPYLSSNETPAGPSLRAQPSGTFSEKPQGER